jgi:hypothetical protein
MRNSAEEIRQLATLDQVIEILEQLNLHERTDVPKAIIATLTAFGLEDIGDLAPSDLITRVLDEQRLRRRRAAAARVKLGPQASS